MIGGHTGTRRAVWVSSGSRIVFGARIFIRVNHRPYRIVLVR